jgi:acetyl esterase/lipase
MTFEIDPQVGAALAAMSNGEALPPPPPAGDVQARRLMLNAMLEHANNVSQPPAPEVETTDHHVTTTDGATVLARWYRLPESGSRAAVLYLHGGGMILGSVSIFDGPVSRYVARTGVPMLSVDYRLAPEHPHPDASRGRVRRACLARQQRRRSRCRPQSNRRDGSDWPTRCPTSTARSSWWAPTPA